MFESSSAAVSSDFPRAIVSAWAMINIAVCAYCQSEFTYVESQRITKPRRERHEALSEFPCQTHKETLPSSTIDHIRHTSVQSSHEQTYRVPTTSFEMPPHPSSLISPRRADPRPRNALLRLLRSIPSHDLRDKGGTGPFVWTGRAGSPTQASEEKTQPGEGGLRL